MQIYFPSPGDELVFLESKVNYFTTQTVHAESAESASYCATIAVAMIKKASALRERIGTPKMTRVR